MRGGGGHESVLDSQEREVAVREGRPSPILPDAAATHRS